MLTGTFTTDSLQILHHSVFLISANSH